MRSLILIFFLSLPVIIVDSICEAIPHLPVLVLSFYSLYVFLSLHSQYNSLPCYWNNFLLVDGDLSINKLLFIQSRAYNKDSASLIASGPRAHIHFWNVFQGGTLMAQFPGVGGHHKVQLTFYLASLIPFLNICQRNELYHADEFFHSPQRREPWSAPWPSQTPRRATRMISCWS